MRYILFGRRRAVTAISADILRGHTEAMILSQLMKGDSYGYELNKNFQSLTGGRYGLKEATLYTALKRMERTGLIRSYWGEEGNGVRRRYYAITPAGRGQWEQARRDWEETRAILDALL